MAIDSNTSDSLEIQQRVLADIRNRTGRGFLQIAGIDTSIGSTAESVLPVLADWVALVPEENVRTAIYSRFGTPHANKYVDQLLKWAEHEQYSLGRDILIQAIVKAVRPKDGRRIWSELRQGKLSGFDAMLVAKLSTFPSVAKEATDYLFAQLAAGDVATGDLQYVAKVKDSRILGWFMDRVDSDDLTVRTIARKIVGKGKALPQCISLPMNAPNRRAEWFSTEVDVARVDEILLEMASRFGVILPPSVRADSAIWNCAPVDRWMKLDVKLKKGDSAEMWLRLEDVDVVEIVLTPATEPSACA